MNLFIRILHFAEGITQLGGYMSVSAGAVEGGPKPVESIKRIPGGYLVGYNGKLFFISDAHVKCAEVTEEIGGTSNRPTAMEALQKAEAVFPQTGSAQVYDETFARAKAETGQAFQPEWFPSSAKIGDIVVDKRGVQRRLTAADFQTPTLQSAERVADAPLDTQVSKALKEIGPIEFGLAPTSGSEQKEDVQTVKLGGRRRGPSSKEKLR